MIWTTEEHGDIPCEYRGDDEDGLAIIRVPDPYDSGIVEIHVPKSQIIGLIEPRGRTPKMDEFMRAVNRLGRRVGPVMKM